MKASTLKSVPHQYVRVRIGLGIRLGTIVDIRMRENRAEYLFILIKGLLTEPKIFGSFLPTLSQSSDRRQPRCWHFRGIGCVRLNALDNWLGDFKELAANCPTGHFAS